MTPRPVDCCVMEQKHSKSVVFFFFCTCGDLAQVGFSHAALGIIPGPVEKASAMHGDTALVRDVTGLPGSPVGEEDWPAIRPGVGGILHAKEIPGSLF